MIKKLTCTLLLVLTVSIGFTQLPKIPFEKYGVAEGLPEEFVRGLIQDEKGFIWIATQSGLAKYDGYHFKVYQRDLDKTDTTGFQLRNLGGGLLKANNGKIWMAEVFNQGGISSFDPLTEKFRTIYVEDSGMSILFFEDKAENIWFKNESAVTGELSTFSLNPTSGEIKQYRIADINGSNLWMRNFGTVESSGTIWLLDDKKNLNRLNPQKDSFEIIIPAGKDLLLSGKADTLRQLSKAGGNRLLLNGTHSLYIFDSKEQKIIKTYAHQLGTTNIIAAIEDLNGQIWVAHEQGNLSLIDPSTNTIETFSYGSSQLPFQKGVKEILTFSRTYNNKEGIWFQALGYDLRIKFFVFYHFVTKTFTVYDYNFNLKDNPLPENAYLYFSLEDHTGLLWLGTRPGLYKEAPKKKQMDLFRYRADEPDGLPSDTIRYLYEDRKKRLWIGTQNGLAIYQPGQENFRVFRNNPSNPASLSSNIITTIQENGDGKIWVGTANGLNLWQESSGSFKRFFYSQSEVNVIAFLFPDKQQRLWLSILGKGVFVLDKSTGKILKSFFPDNNNPASLSSKQIEVFYQDSRGNIWLGDATEGLYRLNATEDGFKHYNTIRGDSNSISSNEIMVITEDGKKRLWIGTDEGLNLYDFAGDRFIRYYNKNGEASSISGHVIDKKGEPWFGTYSGDGLASIDVEQRSFTYYGESKGLLQNDILGGSYLEITKDEYGRFWLPTQRGLSIFDPENKSFVSYFEKDGFQPYRRSYRSIKTNNGDIWIGGIHGLNHIVPAHLLKKDTTVPSIVITQISINDSLYSEPDGTIFKQSVAYTNDIELKHWQKNLSFDFVALHYLRSEDNQYSWKLENYDQNWSSPSKERKASYTNLSPSRYVFRVKASNADGIWNEEGISITITILPPWWLTWWAWFFYAVLLLLMLYWVYGFLLRRKLEHAEVNRLQELDKFKTRLYTNLTHEFRTPLTVISGIADHILTQPSSENLENGLPMLKRNSAQLLRLINQMLDLSKLDSGSMLAKMIHDDILGYLKYLTESFDSFAESKDIRLHILSDFEALYMDFDPEKIQAIFSNLVGNAVKFTPPGGNIYIKLEKITSLEMGEFLEIKVKDTGKGISSEHLPYIFDRFYQVDSLLTRSADGTGIGLALTKELVQLMSGTIEVNSQLGKGSEFTLRLPINNEAPKGNAGEFVMESHPNVKDLVEVSGFGTAEDYEESLPLALLVEDNEDVLSYLELCLHGKYRIQKARNGLQGIQLAIEMIPDVIVSDVMMPEKDGYEVVERLKKDERTSHIPIILLTAKADMESRLEGLESGADAYLSKPFEKKELEVRLRKLIELRQKMTARYAALIPEGKPETQLEKQEDAFLKKLHFIVDANLESETFGIGELCEELAVSRTQLHRKLKALTNKSTSQVIRTIRMKEAKKLLLNSDLNITEIGYAVGYSNPSYFTQEFTKEFGEAPSFFRKG